MRNGDCDSSTPEFTYDLSTPANTLENNETHESQQTRPACFFHSTVPIWVGCTEIILLYPNSTDKHTFTRVFSLGITYCIGVCSRSTIHVGIQQKYIINYLWRSSDRFICELWEISSSGAPRDRKDHRNARKQESQTVGWNGFHLPSVRTNYSVW